MVLNELEWKLFSETSFFS